MTASIEQPAPIDVAVGILMRRNGDVLLGQRPEGKPYAGYWEFPGGKVDPGEDLPAALARELEEEIGVTTEIGAEIHRIVHPYPDRDVRLFFYDVRILSGEPQKLEVADLRWVTTDELMNYQFPEADLPLLNQLRGISDPSS